MKGTKAEQTINSEETSVAHAERADSRDWVRMTGVRPTALTWVYGAGSSGCLLLKHECSDFIIIIIYF